MIGHLVGKFYENSRSTLIVFLTIFLFAKPSECADYSIATVDTDEARPLAKLAKALYERIGHSTKFYFLPAKRSMAEVNAGMRDAELARIIGIDAVYPNLVRVPEPIYSISVSAVVGKASGITSVSWDDLQSLTFVRVLGLRFIEIRTADYEGTAVPSPESVVAMVARGRVDVGLLPTWADTFGYSILEFQACGCPVITTDVRAISEINDWSCGWLIKVPKNDFGEIVWSEEEEKLEISKCIQTALEDSIVDILDNYDSIRQKGYNCVDRIRRYHDPERYGNDLFDLIQGRSPTLGLCTPR